MDSIRKRFSQAEQGFVLAAHSGDDKLLADFAEHWQVLQSDWNSCFQGADTKTRQLAQGVAARIEELATDICAFESQSVSLKDDLLDGLEDVLASLTLVDSPAAPTGPVSDSCDGDRVLGTVFSPEEWLLRNLHNPYPPPHVRFSTEGPKHTKDWFAKARQRIGWTRLLRDRFDRCRSLATDAAFRAYVRDDPSNPLDSDLKTAFLAIKSHAELVYGGEMVTPRLPLKRSRSISPTPSLTFSSGSEDTDDESCPLPLPEGLPNRSSKRKPSDSSNFRSTKRRRTDPPPSPPSIQATSPSKTAEQDPSRSRKRRLSESDSDCPRPKHPRGIRGDRPHAVSDSSSSAAVPGWFDLDKSFQIPKPASTDPPESFEFDLDLFYPTPLNQEANPSILAPLPNIPVPVNDFSALFEMPQIDLLQPNFDCDWNEFLNFEADPSLFPSSPSLTSSSTSTPPFVDDAILSPSCSGLPSPASLLDILPCSSNKGSPLLAGPIIEGHDFLLPPGENAAISNTYALLSVC